MTRVVFDDWTSFKHWVKQCGAGPRYHIYKTSLGELIFAPNKSTRNLIHATYQVYGDDKDMKEAIIELRQIVGNMLIFEVKSFDWDTTRTPR